MIFSFAFRWFFDADEVDSIEEEITGNQVAVV